MHLDLETTVQGEARAVRGGVEPGAMPHPLLPIRAAEHRDSTHLCGSHVAQKRGKKTETLLKRSPPGVMYSSRTTF